jgi:hypothetical protein
MISGQRIAHKRRDECRSAARVASLLVAYLQMICGKYPALEMMTEQENENDRRICSTRGEDGLAP